MSKRFNLFFILLGIILVFGCNDNNIKRNEFGIVIHGGAGALKPGLYTPEEETEYKNKLKDALDVGYSVLSEGGSALDAIEKTIKILEDSPLFNAGKGAVFTSSGTNELDAAIMDGKTLNAGTVARVTKVKNPITLAREVMINSPHVMLVGDGAEIFAEEQGLEIVDPSYFRTEKRWESLQKAKQNELKKDNANLTSDNPDHKFGTVGCVALDKAGNLAAGTSTGGMTNKKYGRVGDVPIIGAGTYANNNSCAISATGWGEFFIRLTVAKDISALMEFKNLSINSAADEVINKKLENLGGNGGVIGIDKMGNITMTFNSDGMFRGYKTSNGESFIGVFTENNISQKRKEALCLQYRLIISL